MISVSFHSDYLAFISINVNNGKKIIERSGILYYSVVFNNKLIDDGKIGSFFNVVLNKLKECLDYYDKEFYISIPTNMVLLNINKVNSNMTPEQIIELNNLTTQIKYGNKISESFSKIIYPFYENNKINSFLSVYFFKNYIAEIQKAFKNNDLKLNGIYVNILNALNTVSQLKNNELDKFSLFCFNESDEIEYLQVKKDKITTYLRYRNNNNKLVFYAKAGEYSEEIVDLLKNDFNDSFFSSMGKIYLIGTKKNQEKIKYFSDKYSFIDVVNPFNTKKTKDKELSVIENLPSYFYNDNTFVEATGILF